jgi:hypothetical protein
MKLRTTLISAAFGLAVVSTAVPPAVADHDHRDGRHAHGGRFDRSWHGNIRYFGARDLHHWRTGHWIHGHHDGRLGWWWVIAGIWYFYPAPVYPYPDPYVPPVIVQQPPVVIQQTPPASTTPQTTTPPPPAPAYWYYCEASKNYYPYVSSCAGGWKKVPATPPDAPQP